MTSVKADNFLGEVSRHVDKWGEDSEKRAMRYDPLFTIFSALIHMLVNYAQNYAGIIV